MSDDEKSKKINNDKIEELSFEMVRGQESPSVKKEELANTSKRGANAWSHENQSKLEDLEKNIETRKSKIGELDRNIQELSSKKIDRMGAVSYSESQIKESIGSLLRNLEGIKKINSLEVRGKGDFMEVIGDIEAEGKILFKTIKAKGVVSVTFGNEGGRIKVKTHKVTGDEFLINKKLKPMLPKVPDLLKDYIENKEGNYTKRIFIENGELKAEFNTPETETGVSERLEKLELEKTTEESLLRELEASRARLQEEKESILASEDPQDGEDAELYKPFDLKKSMEAPLASKIEKKIWECTTDDELENLVNDIKNNKDKIKEDLKATWPDVEAVLKSSKKELLDIVDLWEEWTKNEDKPELQEWSKKCLATLGEAMGIESETEEEDGPKEAEEEPVVVNTNENKEEVPQESPEAEEDASTKEEPEKESTKQEAGIEYIPIVNEGEKFRKIILETGYLRNEIIEGLKPLFESKSIIAGGSELVEIDSTGDSLILRINMREEKHSNGEKKWHLEATLEREEETNEVKFTKFEYKKDDSHYYRLDFKNKLTEILEGIYEDMARKHGEDTNLKNTKTEVIDNGLEIIFEKNDKN